jgi:hypothetical protein
MAKQDNSPAHIKLDERNHVEKPLLEQLAGLGWEVLDLDNKQHPADSFRKSFTEVVLEPVLRERIERINPWLEPDQTEEVIKQLTASFPGTNLIENNRHLLGLLLENTSVSENRQTGEKSPTVRFSDSSAHRGRWHQGAAGLDDRPRRAEDPAAREKAREQSWRDLQGCRDIGNPLPLGIMHGQKQPPLQLAPDQSPGSGD